MKKLICLLLALFMLCSLCACQISETQEEQDGEGNGKDGENQTEQISEAKRMGYVVITDYLNGMEGKDVSAIIQKVIDENPNRTIYFPDGTYHIEKSIFTSANPKKSVMLELSNYAVLKATFAFGSLNTGAMICLGGKDASKDNSTNGSNYGIHGGIIDGTNVAMGISICSGRETRISDVSLKNTTVGIYIKNGSNNGSSDADICNVNIVGNGGSSTGMIIEGHDNTFTNIRISNVKEGVVLRSGGNVLKNVHPLFDISFDYYSGSCAFSDSNGENLYEYCYGDNFNYCFYNAGNLKNTYSNCFGYWWSNKGKDQYGIYCTGKFRSVVNNFRLGFNIAQGGTRAPLFAGYSGGTGCIDNLLCSTSSITDTTYLKYLTGKVIE